MNFKNASLLSMFWGGNPLSYLDFLGLNQQPASPVPLSHSAILNVIPPGFEHLSVSFVRDNLAVIPGEWDSGDIKTAFYDIKSDQPGVQDSLSQIRSSDFIAWDASFFNIIGPHAKLERIQSFEGKPIRVHEAPAYVPETNELVYSDTADVGRLWAIEIDTHVVSTPYIKTKKHHGVDNVKLRELRTKPALPHVNGAKYHKGRIYATTNGGSVRGIYAVDPHNGTAVPVVNNFRGRHLNSPNDLVFDSNSNMWFTDPPYGWYVGFPGVQPPELPTGIYFFNTKSKALTAVSNSVVVTPNGLAFSPDGSTLYVAESNSTAGKPLGHYPASLRNVWAFDVQGSVLGNARMIHQTESGWPDGLQVTRNGYLLIAVFGGVDIIDPTSGLLLGKINTPDDIVFNLERGPRRGDCGVWLLTGQNYIYKVMIKEM